MKRIQFSTLFVDVNGVPTNAVRYTRETETAIYDVTILPSGEQQFQTNDKPVESLPKLPSTRELLKFVRTELPLVQEYFRHRYMSEAAKTKWWELKRHADEYTR